MVIFHGLFELFNTVISLIWRERGGFCD
uniref:Uncharacterized protein n=1 Tax=Rhizophora mucronata TaxID=61149 RepID=A0A2P2PRZ4_RHIMU